MNTSLGYSKKTLTNSNVLLSGGGDKALSEFIGSLNWDSTNKKLQYKSASSTDFTDLITFGSNAFDSTSYLPLSGGTLSGTGSDILTVDRNGTAPAWVRFAKNGTVVGYLGVDNSKEARFHDGTNNYKIWHEGNDGSGSTLDADTVDGLHVSNLVKLYSYSIPPSKGVRITFTASNSCIISCCRTNARGQLVLIGTGYGEAGTLRNSFTELVSCDESKFLWSLPQVSNISTSVEIMHVMTSGNNATVYVHSSGTVTFTEISELTSPKQNNPLLNSSNYTDYTVTKEGSGASGSWGIDITGSAGSVAWENVTDKPSTFTPSSHTHDYIKAKSIYAFTSSDLPNTFNHGVSAGFVNSNSGFGSYGSVLTVRTHSGGGGTLQLYAPYSNTYGGDHLKARFGDYGTDSGNSWTTLKTIAWLDDIPTKSSWNYDDMYVSSLTTSGNYLRWIKNGSNNDITIPYATSSGTSNASKAVNLIDNPRIADVDTAPRQAGMDIFLVSSSASSGTYPPAISSKDGPCITLGWDTYTNWGAQMHFGMRYNDDIHWRAFENGSWTAWKTIIDSRTIGSQSVNYATSAGSATNVTGVVAIANGGTGASTRLNALKNLTNENVSTNAEYFLTITSSWGKGGYTSVAQAKTVLAMTGATSSANGTAGVVPAPSSNGYDTKFLRADGTWSIPAYPTKTSWDYDDVYVKSVSISGNSLRINKNGTDNDLTIPYASKAALDSNGRSLVTYKEYSETFPPNDGTQQWYTLLTYTNNYYSKSAIIEINTRKATATILINFYNTNSPYITFLGYYGSPSAAGGGFTGGVRVIADGGNAVIQFQFMASTESSGYRQLGVKVYSEIPARWVLADSLVADTTTYESFLANVKATSKCLTGGGLMPTANNTYNIGSSSSVYKHVYATIFHGALDGNASSATKLNDDNLTLWGQSFNGTANVSGDMTDVGAVSASGDYVITKTSGATKFAVVNNNGSIELLAQTNRGVYDRTNGKWLISTNGANTLMSCGNVAIASAINTTYKLYVEGTIGATGNTTLGGTLDVTGATTLSSYLTVAGNLGVGTTSPSYALDVVGNARTKLMYFYNRANNANAGYIGAGSSYVDYIYFQAYTNNGLYMGANNGFDLVILPDHNVGVGTTEPSYKMHVNGNVGASNFYTTSDRSKKQNISSFSEHISKFQLKDTEKWHYGVIAQEVPEMFRDGKEGNMTVNYNSVLSYYVGCLENRVKELEDKLAKYEELKNK